MDNTLILIDGSSFIFRAFHAMPNLTSPDKKPTGATYGIVNMLKQMLKKYNTPHWCCIFDAPGKTFRHDIYPEYKANRAETPTDLIPQFEDIYSIIKALGIPVIIEPYVEADDIIGTIAIKASSSGYKVLIATGDKDFAQLVDDKINLINTMNNELLDIDGVVSKFGVKPEQIIDFLTLVGDKVDNVPGIDKCGPKTASKWLNEYNTLNNIIENIDKFNGIVGANLRNSVGWLDTARDLITIRTNIDLSHVIPTGIEHLTLKPADKESLISDYARLGFKTWLKQIQDENIGNSLFNDMKNNIPHTMLVVPKKTIVNVESNQHLQQITDILINTGNTICVHLLAEDKKSQNIKYIFISDNDYIYIAVNANQTIAEDDLFNDNVINYNDQLKQILLSHIPKICINYKETLNLCKNSNIVFKNIVGDITLAHYILNSKNPHTLQHIYKDIAGIDIFEQSPNKAKDIQNTMQNQPYLIENYVKVMENSSNILHIIESRLDESELDLYRNIELPLAKVLIDIETGGVKLDITKFKILESELTSQLKILEDKIYKMSNSVFNINSSKQLQDVLFNTLKLPTIGLKKNTTGFSTDEDSLKILEASGIEIATYLLEYRGLSKLLNTYVSKLPALVDSHNKIHTTYEQAQVASGRLSSRDPNLQNIPIKSGWGRKIRQCFIADEGHVLICADYSQIELRILAHFSQDENLINAFNTNQDIHSITASEIFHKSIQDITHDERRYAKTINFSLLYGKTVFGLANELKIDRATAKLYIDTYFAKYPKILQCLEGIKDFARNNGYVSTLFGRKIYLPNINASNRIIREAEERLALNAPMQGTSADIIKIAMCKINDWLIEENLQSRMILQVHDELILHVPESEIEIIKANLSNLMTTGVNKLSVKLTVDVKVAKNWDEAH
ncbi:MAG: DNA polymerase I [Neisseriaceae bacterium]